MVMIKIVSSCQDDLASISGQRPIVTNLENLLQILKPEKILTQVKSYIRKNKMYEFIDSVNIALPN